MFCYSANLGWDVAQALAPLGDKAAVHDDLRALVSAIAAEARPGDHVLVMSNGGFGGIHDKLLMRLGQTSADPHPRAPDDPHAVEPPAPADPGFPPAERGKG